MALNIAAALFSRLSTDGTLTGDLATYGGATAVFTGRVPEASPRPYVFIHGLVANDPADTKTTRGREIIAQIDAVADTSPGASTIVIDRVAERIRALLHRFSLTVTGFTVRVASVAGPVAGESDASVFVRTLSLRLVAEES